VVGAIGWWLCGGRLARWVRDIWLTRDRRRLAVHILTGYAVFLVVFQIYPFDFILSGEELARKLHDGRLTLSPFADAHKISLYAAAAKAGRWLPVGCLAAMVLGRGRPIRAALLGGGLLVLAVEFVQIFVFTREATATDVALGTLGAGLADGSRTGSDRRPYDRGRRRNSGGSWAQ
jgi:glycopeptide antibiotics resistance protein